MDTIPERSEVATVLKRIASAPLPLQRSLLYEEIASLVGAGMGMREALEDLLARSGGRRKRALTALADAVAHGVAPGDAMRRRADLFAPVEAALVATGDRTGRYDRSFRDAAEEIGRGRRDRATLLRAVAYPLFLLHFAIAVPGCSVMQLEHGPRSARIFVVVALLGLWAAIGGVWLLHRSRRRTRSWGRALATLPFVGDAARSGALARACRVAAALCDAGTGLPESLEDAAEAAGNGWIASDLVAAADLVRAGTPVMAALSRVGAFDTAARSLLETGDRTGSLEDAFTRIAGIEDERAQAAARRIAVGLGAAIFLIVAVAVFLMMANVLTRSFGGF